MLIVPHCFVLTALLIPLMLVYSVKPLLICLLYVFFVCVGASVWAAVTANGLSFLWNTSSTCIFHVFCKIKWWNEWIIIYLHCTFVSWRAESFMHEQQSLLLKDCADVLAPFVTELFNRSLFAGMFPTQFKAAFITPILKKSDLDPSQSHTDPYRISRCCQRH